MKGIKRFFKEHRIFTILMAVVIVCLILVAFTLFQLFGNNGKGKYGSRLDGIEDVPITTEKKDDFRDKLVENGKVKTAGIDVTGRIVYINIYFEQNVDLVEAQGIALKSLEEFSEEELKFYDFQFTLREDSSNNNEGFVIEGAHNKNGNGLIWNNNRKVEKQETNAVDGD
jgi:hypothetical protein